MIFTIVIVLICFKKDMVNMYFTHKTSSIIRVSNILIKPRADFIILSKKDPVIIAIKNKDMIFDITSLDSPTNIQIYQHNFKILKRETHLTSIYIGSKRLPAIEAISNQGVREKEIKVILNPKLVLTIKIEKYQDDHDLEQLQEYFRSNVTWTN